MPWHGWAGVYLSGWCDLAEARVGELRSETGSVFLNNTFMLVGNAGTILQSDPVGVAVLSAAANLVTGAYEVKITNSELGGIYRLQACTNLSVGLWTDVTTFTQTQTVTTVVVLGGAVHRSAITAR